jgi:soluble lytic murein transglycosylase
MKHLIASLAATLLLFGASSASAELLSYSDRQAYRSAFSAARAANWSAAKQLAAGASERLPSKILLWLELGRSDAARFPDIIGFAETNPDWPQLDALREHAEQVLDDVPEATVRAYFDLHRPITPKGSLRFATVLANAGQREAAMARIRELWLETDIGPDIEQAVLNGYGDVLRPQDHAQRLDRLLWAAQPSAARRQMSRAPEDSRSVAEARLAFEDQRGDAEALFARIPVALRNDPGLILDRARWLRRNDRLEDAVAALRQRPADLVRPAAWISEREIVVRRLLDEGKDQLAYAIATWRGLGESGAALAESTFLSGWIALRRLGDPTTAYTHFSALYENATLSATRARGAFWMARAADAMGKNDVARSWFAVAAAHGTTFYGQLASASLHTSAHVEFPPEPQPSRQETDALNASEVVRAARMLTEIGQDDLAKLFVLKVAATAKTPEDHKLVASLAGALGALDISIAAAKRAGHDGVPLLAEGFPILAFKPHPSVEAPLVLAIARQESAFDKAAVSRAGALGLMQLKPETAHEMTKALGMQFSRERLVTDSVYNLTLGQAFLDRLLERFGGSYILAAAAYNAGPARVKQWLDAFGDPRGHTVDPVDWIESIPYPETRNYVQRVLENLQIYRLRLGTAKSTLALAQDLQR